MTPVLVSSVSELKQQGSNRVWVRTVAVKNEGFQGCLAHVGSTAAVLHVLLLYWGARPMTNICFLHRKVVRSIIPRSRSTERVRS